MALLFALWKQIELLQKKPKKYFRYPQPLAVQSAGKDGAVLSIKSSPPHLDIGKEGGGGRR